MSYKKRTNLERSTNEKPEGKHERDLHPLKGTVIKGYKDKDSHKDILDGVDKEHLKNQTHSATSNNRKVADTIQNSKNS